MRGIFCSDLHLTGEKPIARKDVDWHLTQKLMLREIADIARQKNSDLLIVGDIFDHPRVATEVVNYTISELLQAHTPVGREVFILAGNHDLPGHSFDSVEESSIGILLKIFNDVETNGQCNANHFARDLQKTNVIWPVRLTHQLVFPDKESKPPTDKGKTADEMLDEYQEADWIICGDGHFGFHHIRKSEGGDRHVINLGCTIRHKANEANYLPYVWYIDTDLGIVERIPLSDDPAMISREHLDGAKAKENRIDAFLEVVASSGEVSLSFLDNLEAKLDVTTGQDFDELTALIEKTKQESK